MSETVDSGAAELPSLWACVLLGVFGAIAFTVGLAILAGTVIPVGWPAGVVLVLAGAWAMVAAVGS